MDRSHRAGGYRWRCRTPHPANPVLPLTVGTRRSSPERGSEEEPQPTGGTMDTSRRPDGPIDSRADRQLRPTQGRHIMTWRQTWRQRWRPTRPPSPRHHHDPRPRRQPVVHGCRVNPASSCGDHVLDRRSFQDSPHRQGALRTNGATTLSAVSSVPSGCRSGRGARSRRRPPAWRLGASGGRRSWASEPNRSGARDGRTPNHVLPLHRNTVNTAVSRTHHPAYQPP